MNNELMRLAERVEAYSYSYKYKDQNLTAIAAELRTLAAQSAHGPGISGEVVEIGDDETGQPRIVIHTTREEVMAFTGNLLLKCVIVIASPPNAPDDPT